MSARTEVTGEGQGVAVDPGGPGQAVPGRVGIGPPQDHGRASLICLAITVVTMAASGAIVAVSGVPRETTEVSFILGATLLGFGFCGGQAAMVTGFMAMKQRQNPLYVLVAIAGFILGVLGFVAIFGLSMWIGAQRAGLRF
jgi:hypothetical protein